MYGYENARDSHKHVKKKLQITWKDNLLNKSIEMHTKQILTHNICTKIDKH